MHTPTLTGKPLSVLYEWYLEQCSDDGMNKGLRKVINNNNFREKYQVT
jgi:hypothetical protein